MSVNERIKILIKALSLNPRSFSEYIGAKEATTRSYLDRGSKPSSDYLELIARAIVNINTNWLLTGEGEPFKNTMSEPAKSQAPGRGGMPLVVTVDQNRDRENIEMVETQAVGGYIQHHLEPEYIKDLPKLYLPGPEFRNATYRCFQVKGESMAPGLQPEDYVIGSYVHNWPTNISEGYVYIVVTKDDVLVKRLLNRIEPRDKVVLLSDNDAFATQEIHKSEIIELWRAKAKISFKFPNMRYDTHKKIANLEADVFELQQAIRILLPKNNTTDLR